MPVENSPKKGLQSTAKILQQTLFSDELPQSTLPTAEEPSIEVHAGPTGRYDFDLAEFPFFHFDKNPDHRLSQPMTYTDTITGKDGIPITREWKVYPSAAYGFGGPTTQLVLYDLLQLYTEQGCRGNQIQFGTLYNLLQRRGIRRPSTHDYQRLRRDIEILCSCRFHCKNAFWDRERQAYVDMNWQLFNSVFYFKENPHDSKAEMPFGFIEVSSVLQQIVRTRGFTLGVKRTGKPSAGNPHAGFDVAGTGNVAWSRSCDTRRRKGGTTGNTNIGLNRRASPRPYVGGPRGAAPRGYLTLCSAR